jgi:tetratricopeptide (TPR) repeat protein
MPRENFYDEAAEDRALSRRIKAIVSIALAVGVLMVGIWLMLTPGGQIMRAQLNLWAPASAYKALGDQDLAGGQVQRAADAYLNALKLDQKNYEYAMLVGKTKEMVGDRDAAIKAYMICVNLKETAVEPYVRLRDLYKVLGDGQMAENWRAQGYNKTGDATLAPGT